MVDFNDAVNVALDMYYSGQIEREELEAVSMDIWKKMTGGK